MDRTAVGNDDFLKEDDRGELTGQERSDNDRQQ